MARAAKLQAPEKPIARARLSAQALGTSIVVRLLATHNLLLSALRDGLGSTLSLARFDLLMQLDRQDGQTLAALSRKMLVTAGNVTGLVDRAERDGIVERRADARDRRLTRVHLTSRGERLATSASRAHRLLAERIVAPLRAQERDDLRRLLGRFRFALESKSLAAVRNHARAPSGEHGEHERRGR